MKVQAPAKINLFLHVTGRRDDGYHLLESLVVFVKDIFDTVTITPAPVFDFIVDGPYAQGIPRDENNLVVKAARGLAQLYGKQLDCTITLTKNLPVAAGIGGGSADAAAIIRALIEFWQAQGTPNIPIADFLLGLGADIPVCFVAQNTYMRGIGEILDPVDLPGNLYVLLVNNGQICSTAQVFQNYTAAFSDPIEIPVLCGGLDDLIGFLKTCRNDLYLPALTCVPEIQDIITVLEQQSGCHLARMSGSGATCFGLFADPARAQMARDKILSVHPNWWVHAGQISC